MYLVQAEEVAKAFVTHYYTTFDSDRSALAGLYQDNSTLTFEGEQFRGPAAIVGKITAIPAQTIKHEPKTLDVQQSLNDSAMLINVTGDMAIDGGNPLKFTQTFQLVATGPGAFYVHNDMFRLNYC
eukprot:g3175.t1